MFFQDEIIDGDTTLTSPESAFPDDLRRQQVPSPASSLLSVQSSDAADSVMSSDNVSCPKRSALHDQDNMPCKQGSTTTPQGYGGIASVGSLAAAVASGVCIDGSAFVPRPPPSTSLNLNSSSFYNKSDTGTLTRTNSIQYHRIRWSLQPSVTVFRLLPSLTDHQI